MDSLDKIKQKYRELKKHLGHSPSSTEFYRDSEVSRRELENYYGSEAYSRLVIDCDDIPNKFSRPKSNLEEILVQYGELTRSLGKLPTIADWKFYKYRPSVNGIEQSHKLKWSEIPSKFFQYASGKIEWKDILHLFSFKEQDINTQKENDKENMFGFVYLMKSGKYFKIGRSNSVGRREYELGIQLPEKPKLIHEIKTDDPIGIEEYWHKRFSAKRTNGEWFALNSKEIAAFKLWKKIY